MNPQKQTNDAQRERVAQALAYGDASVRLKAALAAGSDPDPAVAPRLVERCGVEPDFFVRDMLTWALTRQAQDVAVPLVLAELDSATPQARSQALHTLSKIRPAGAWDALTDSMFADPDDEVARAAWRSGVILVPDTERAALAKTLATQLGRGTAEVKRSLAMAFAELSYAAEDVLEDAAGAEDANKATHARATLHLLRNPEAGFGYALEEANRATALGFRQMEAG